LQVRTRRGKAVFMRPQGAVSLKLTRLKCHYDG